MSSRVSALGLALLVCTLTATSAFAAAPVIVSGDTADATAGSPFSYQIAATNNPISFSATNLPAGLNINTQSGLISGSTTAVGTYNVVLSASNQPPGQQNTTNTGTKALTLTVLAVAPNITNALEIRTSLGIPVNFELTATGFPTPVFTVGSLPPGLVLDSTFIRGTPLQGGVFNSNITATTSGPKSSGGTDTKALLFNITSPPIITSPLLITGDTSTPIDYRITANNNPTSFGFTAINGITISPAGGQITGILSGTPTAAGRFLTNVTAVNALNQVNDPCTFSNTIGTATGQIILAISSTPGAPAITCTSNANATVATPFVFGITASNAPSSFSIAPPLSAGLSLNTSTGIISGVPTRGTDGTYNYTVTATNAAGSGSAALTLTIGRGLPFFVDFASFRQAVANQLFQFDVNTVKYPPESGVSAPTFTITDLNPAGAFTGMVPSPANPVAPAGATGNIRIHPSLGRVSGTPLEIREPVTQVDTEDVGQYTVTVRATNNEGFVEQSFTLRIVLDGLPIVGGFFFGNQGAFVVENCPFSYDADIAGATTYIINNSLSSVIPPDLNIVLNDSSGVLSGTPGTGTGASPAQQYVIVIDGFANGSLLGRITFDLAVSTSPTPPPEKPVIFTNSFASGVVGTTLNYPISTSPDYTDASKNQVPLVYSANPIPAGTGLLSDKSISNAIVIGDPQVSVRGTLTEVGTISSTISVLNSTGSDSKNVSFSISPVTIFSSLAVTGAAQGAQVGKQFLTLNFPLLGAGLNAPYFIRASGNANVFDATGLPPGLSVNPQTGSISGIPTQAGVFNVSIFASNGFSSDTKTLVITVDAKPATSPTITNTVFTASVFDSIFTDPIFDLNAVDATTPTVYSALGLPQGLSMNPTTGVIAGLTAQVGTYNVILLATDGKNTAPITDDEADARILVLTVAQVPPVITSALTDDAPVNQAYFYAITTTGSQPITFTASPLPPGLVLSGANIVGTPTAEGFYPVTLTATNGAGTDTEVLQLTITRVPSINGTLTNGTLTATGVVGAPFTYTASSAGFPAPIITIDAAGSAQLAAFGLTFNGTSITGTPNQPGTIAVTFTSTNIVGVDTKQLLITINNVQITSALVAGGTVNQAFAYTITATGGANVFTASNLPAGLSITGASITGTPFLAGQTSVPISASNGVGTANATLVIAISTIPGAPAISSPLSVNGVLGNNFLYKITATNSPTSFNATGLPPGLAISTTDGFITGTPTATGSFPVIISATNSIGTGSATLVIAISQSSGSPAITSPLTATGVQGNPFTYQITSIGTNLTFAASGLPTGLSLDTVTGLISGTPTVAGANIPVTLNVTNPQGAASATLLITILSQSPQISSPLNVGSPVGSPFSYTITATGSLPITYGLVGSLPAGLTFNAATATISGTPTAEGVTTVTLTASNAFPPPDSETLTITVGPRAPIITSALTATGSTQVPFSYQIVATGSTPITFGASSLPPGLSVNTSTGLISGTPTTVGQFTTTITATNSIGFDTKIVAITINEALDDFDQDGFPNELEIALGTDPFNPNSTPFGGNKAPVRDILSLTQVRIKLNFASAGKDSVSQKGTLQLPAGYALGGKTASVVVGGFKADFTLSTKFTGALGTNKISIKPGKNNAPAKYSLTLKGAIAASLTDEGLTNETIDKNLNAARTVRTFLLIDALGTTPLLYENSKQLLYTAKAGKTGSASGK